MQSMRIGFTFNRSDTRIDLLKQRRIQYVGISDILPKLAKPTTHIIIKVDKNLPFYVHGTCELIEHGVDVEGAEVLQNLL